MDAIWLPLGLLLVCGVTLQYATDSLFVGVVWVLVLAVAILALSDHWDIMMWW